jgi:lipopolysaccharide export LptBFGC system permease protein LptF
MMSGDQKQIVWWLVIVAVALRLYFVRELLAALSLFTLVFVALALVISALYLLQRLWNSGITRLTDS